METFKEFKRIGLFGMSYAGLDEAFRIGILQYRGDRHKWLFHDVGHTVEEVCRRLQDPHFQTCDLFIGHVGNETVETALRETGKPVLNISGSHAVQGWETHGFDYKAIGRAAAEYFHDAGFRNFLYVPGFPIESERKKERAFVEALLDLGHEDIHSFRIGANKTVVRYHPEEKPMSLSSMTDWMQHTSKPLAVFCGTDTKARELMDFAQFRGVKIPEEVSFLGCDNNETFCHMLQVSLSSISLPGNRVGWLVAEHGEALLEGKFPPRLQKLGPERIVVRHSSDVVAIEDPVVSQAVTLMRKNAHERITIEEISADLPLSRRRFSERFRDALGRSPLEELTRLRVLLAKDRLLDTDQTMFHIALDCGFADAESMAREFKRWESMTPNAFRKKHRQH